MKTFNYILDGHDPVPEPDIVKWAKWWSKNSRIVARNTAKMKLGGKEIGEITISTVFLGVDHSLSGDRPILFETMVFGGPIDGEMDRCSTWEAAEKMHEKMCEKVKLAVEEMNNGQ